MAHKGPVRKKGRKPAPIKEKRDKSMPRYYKGEKMAPTAKPKLTRNVVNKTFRTDAELTEFILTEGTFKDKITVMTLVIIREQDEKALKQLMAILENIEGGDKAYLAITHAVKILEYYIECKTEPATEEEKENILEKPEPHTFCAFIERTGFTKRLTEAISKQMASPFLKEKLVILIKSMVEKDILSGQIIDILMDTAEVQIDKEIMLIFSYIIKNRKIQLISILRDRITQTILYHKNFRKVKYFVTLALTLNRTEWILEDADYKVYVVPLIKGFSAILKRAHEEVDNPRIKNKSGTAVISSLLKGLLRFIKWQKTVSSLTENYTAELFKDVGYIIFKLAYNDNTRYSLPALNILETANNTEKINYSRVLGDTIRKYIYLNDLSRCEILNKAVNIPGREVQSKVVHSAYHAPIGSKYPLGCMMVSHEVNIDLSDRVGYLLLCKSHDKEIASSAEKIVRSESIPVYNIWS